MVSLRSKHTVCLVIMLVYLAGCIATPTSTSEPTIAPIDGSEPSGRASLTPTNPLQPTVALAPTETPAPTLTEQLPVLAKVEALFFVANMQKTNGNCELPCWWGITPGKTTSQEANRILSSVRQFKSLRSEIGFHLEEYANIDVGIYTRGDLVTEIWVFSWIPDLDETAHYDPSWQRYSLKELLSRHGVPSQVWLGFALHTGDGDQRPPESIPYFYELHIIYSDLGVVVRYAGPASRGDVSRACVSLDQLKDMRIFIRTSSAGDLEGPPWEAFTGEPPTTLSEMTGLGLEEFYHIVASAEEPVCVESLVSLN